MPRFYIPKVLRESMTVDEQKEFQAMVGGLEPNVSNHELLRMMIDATAGDLVKNDGVTLDPEGATYLLASLMRFELELRPDPQRN